MPKKNEPLPGSLGFRIRRLREENNLSQESLAKLLNSNKNTISLIESGKQDLYVHQLREFAQALNTSEFYLATGIDDENYAIAADLDLSNDSIVALKLQAKVVKERQKEEDCCIIRNYYKDVIDTLAHHPDFTEHLYQYFFRYDFSSFVRRVDDFDGEFIEYEQNDVKDILGFPFEDFERVYRLRILDDLKVIRDSLAEERKRVNEENKAFANKKAIERNDLYKEPKDNQETVSANEKFPDEKCHQDIILNLISTALKEKGGNEDGND